MRVSRPGFDRSRYALGALLLGAGLVVFGVSGHTLGPSIVGPPSDRGMVVLALAEVLGLLLAVGASIVLGTSPGAERGRN